MISKRNASNKVNVISNLKMNFCVYFGLVNRGDLNERSVGVLFRFVRSIWTQNCLFILDKPNINIYRMCQQSLGGES